MSDDEWARTNQDSTAPKYQMVPFEVNPDGTGWVKLGREWFAVDVHPTAHDKPAPRTEENR